LTVSLGDRSYPIVGDSLDALGRELRAVLSPRRCVLVTNPVVGALYRERARASLLSAGFDVDTLDVPDGEAHKSLDTWRALVEALLALKVERGTPVIALGGGVTGDLVGFAAASVMRGLPFVQVPTTLLAMVDSSVGGKTGVNTPAGKNLVGAFHQPVLVLAALDTLATLDASELRCGLGEVVKHAVLDGPEHLDWLDGAGDQIAQLDPERVAECVRRSCSLKAAVVAQDERESGVRAHLNLGHTVGHALERTLGYGALRHGEAVGLGLLAEARMGVRMGVTQPGVPKRIAATLARLGLPTSVEIDPERVADAAQMDKKNQRGIVRAVLPVSLGSVELVAVTRSDLLFAADAVAPRRHP
jgi:3-dehydroquinate synthase